MLPNDTNDDAGNKIPSAPTTWYGNYMETVRIALPVSLSLLGQIAMGTTDVIFVGRLGPDELAASSLAVHVYFLIFMLIAGVTMASNSLISQYRGQKNTRMIRRTVRQALWVSILLSSFGWIFLGNMENILLLLGQDPNIANIAGRYMDYFMWSLLPAVAFVALRSFCVGLQQAKLAAYITWSIVPLNALLDYVLIFGGFGIPAMHIEGAGLATSITSITLFVVLAIVIAYKTPFKEYQIFANFWRPDWIIFRKLFTLGSPIAIRVTLEEGIFAASALMIGLIGVVELAAHSILVTILSISYMFSVGIADATTSRVGYEFGARNYIQSRANGWIGIAVAASFMGCAALIAFTFPSEISGFILDASTPNAEEVLILAASLLVVGAATQIPDGIQLVIAGCLAGVNDTKAPMYTALICYWGIGLFSAWVLAFKMDMGVIGFWIGLFIGLVGNAVVNSIRYWWLAHNDDRLDKQQLLAEQNDHG